MSREGHGRDRLSLNYRSFMFGKLPPPACPGLCYLMDDNHPLWESLSTRNDMLGFEHCSFNQGICSGHSIYIYIYHNF